MKSSPIALPSFILVSFFLLSLVSSPLPSTAWNIDGFSAQLISRNSRKLNPPKHNSNSNKAFRPLMGSIPLPNPIQSQVNPDNGEYIMKLSLGTPPLDIYGIVDTGSDLIWAQCLPCQSCFNQINPKFDPQKSSTFTQIPCQSNQCNNERYDTVCSSEDDFCTYTYGYMDGSVTRGILAQDTITFKSYQGQPISFPNIVFGCGHDNSGTFNENEMGLIGLGGGPLSLVSQLGSSLGSKSFSHCLVPFHTDPTITSKISFGNGSEVNGEGVVTLALVESQDPNPYYVTLEGISVGDTYVPFSGSSSVVKGNMFIDSGTPLTMLPKDFYERVIREVKEQVVGMSAIEDEQSLGTQLCYRTPNNLEGPILRAHFEGGDMVLTPTQTFIPVANGVFCFAMTNTSDDVGLYGNYAQTNFLVGYDLERRVVSFKPTDCTKE